MSFLKFHPLNSAARFIFKDPDVPAKTYKADSFKDLISLIRGYRGQNELPEIEFLETVVEHYLCGLPENKGKCLPRQKLRRGIIPTIRGGIALLTTVLYSKFVSKEEADVRSAICAACPHNVFLDKGNFIKWSDSLAEQATGGRKSRHHDQLGNCALCSCPLRAKVWYGGKIEYKGEELDALPDFCWQKKESLKHGNN